MKKVLYLHIFFMMLCCLVECMHNNTTAIIPVHGSLVFSIEPSFVLQQGIPVVGNTTYAQPNRKERRAQGQRKKELTTEEKAQLLISKIDEKIVGGYSNVLNYYFKRGCTLSRINSARPDDLIQELAKIDKDIKQMDGRRLMNVLEERDSVFRLLVNRLVMYTTKKEIKGSTIDGFFYEDHSFPMLSNTLGSYIGEKIKKEILKEYNQVKNNLWIIPPDIHFTLLFGHEHPINENTIKIMKTERFIRVDDITGNTIYWDTETGERCDDKYNKNWHARLKVSSDGDWLSKEEYAQTEKRDFNIILCQTFTDTGLYFGCEAIGDGMASFINSFNQAGKTPVLYLYKKPDFASWLCQTALLNSLHNNTELDALLQSHFIKKSYLSMTSLGKNTKRIAQRMKKEAGAQ